VTVVLPELLMVSVCGLLDPAETFPKLRVVALGTSVPAEPLPEPELVAGEPALVKPTQPVTESRALIVTITENMPKEDRPLCLPHKRL